MGNPHPHPHLQRPLVDGYIHHWLVAGPQVAGIEGAPPVLPQPLRRDGPQPAPGVELDLAAPAKAGSPPAVGDGGRPRWRYARCEGGHLLDLSGHYLPRARLRSWFYAQLSCARPGSSSLTVHSSGPVDLWCNGSIVELDPPICRGQSQTRECDVELGLGQNELFLCLHAVAGGETPHFLALSVENSSGGDVVVQIPLAENVPARYELFEDFLDRLYLDREVYAADDEVRLRWPEGLRAPADYTARLVHASNRIYAEAMGQAGDCGDRVFLKAMSAPEGEFRVVLMPSAREYYEHGVRVQRALPLTLQQTDYALRPYGSWDERRLEALRYGSRQQGVFAQVARMALERWDTVVADPLVSALAQDGRQTPGSDLQWMGLLGMFARYGSHGRFPAGVGPRLRSAALSYPFGRPETEPGVGGEPAILHHAGRLLAGQIWPDDRFSHDGTSGREQARQGRDDALAWMERWAHYGFEDWGTPGSLAAALVALSHLMDLAADQTVWELAGLLMDKILIVLALNSHQGICGSGRRQAEAQGITNGRLLATAGISRLMWGVGTWNHHIAGPVSLACCENYAMPAIVADLIGEPPEGQAWCRERHGAGDDGVFLASYRTADYLLASVQDYRPGALGAGEHLWQATLGPDALVFTNHPGSTSGSAAVVPGFWRGNRLLPRLAQWRDLVMALYQVPDDDPLGYTHAHFPTAAFDQWRLEAGWALAAVGRAYVALWSSRPVTLMEEGSAAYRELRAGSGSAIWVCRMGTQGEYGSFDNFCGRMKAVHLDGRGLSISIQDPGGATVAFGWEEPLRVQGQVRRPDGEWHFDGPHCAAPWPGTEMVVASGDEAMRLQFPAGT